MCQNKPHKWAKEIKAWAEGAHIEYRLLSPRALVKHWRFIKNPSWMEDNDIEYRIKPTTVITYVRVSVDAISGDISFGKPSKNKDTTPTYEGNYVLIGFNKVVCIGNVLQSIIFEPLEEVL